MNYPKKKIKIQILLNMVMFTIFVKIPLDFLSVGPGFLNIIFALNFSCGRGNDLFMMRFLFISSNFI